jgi:hypothetical protein
VRHMAISTAAALQHALATAINALGTAHQSMPDALQPPLREPTCDPQGEQSENYHHHSDAEAAHSQFAAAQAQLLPPCVAGPLRAPVVTCCGRRGGGGGQLAVGSAG